MNTDPTTTAPSIAFVETSRAPAIPPPQRSILIDVVRGMAILLVALGHTNQGVTHRGWWGARAAVSEHLTLDIYVFHMPAFFFVSGIFLFASMARRTQARFTTDKLRTMIYPYALWSLAGWAVPYVVGSAMSQKPVGPHVFLIDVLTGKLSWFLPTICFAVLLGMLLRKLPMPLLLVLSVVACYAWPPINVDFIDRGLRYFPFLVAGMWLRGNYVYFERLPRRAAALLALLCAGDIYIQTWIYTAGFDHFFVPLGLVGICMLLCLARCLDHTRVARLLAWAGAGSLGIFLMSPYAQGLGRLILVAIFHTTNPWLQLILPTALAVLVPAWIYQHRMRLKVDWMFVWPFDRSARPVTPQN